MLIQLYITQPLTWILISKYVVSDSRSWKIYQLGSVVYAHVAASDYRLCVEFYLKFQRSLNHIACTWACAPYGVLCVVVHLCVCGLWAEWAYVSVCVCVSSILQQQFDSLLGIIIITRVHCVYIKYIRRQLACITIKSTIIIAMILINLLIRAAA